MQRVAVWALVRVASLGPWKTISHGMYVQPHPMGVPSGQLSLLEWRTGGVWGKPNVEAESTGNALPAPFGCRVLCCVDGFHSFADEVDVNFFTGQVPAGSCPCPCTHTVP